jgi:glycosyltransferase involved in cell wall biosynthesis
MNVKISVIMSVYNGGEFLKEAIESILNQSYKNIEFVIINDGSSDDSLVIIQKYMAMDSRILLINQKNMGLTKSLNIGVMRATGKYIARQDADDISMPDRFKLFFEFLEKDGDIDMYSTPAILFNKDHPITKVIPNYFRRNGFNQSMLNYHNSLIHGTLIIKSSLIKKFKYNEFFKYSQDFELYH